MATTGNAFGGFFQSAQQFFVDNKSEIAGATGLAAGFGAAGSQIAGGIFAERQANLNAFILERRGRQAERAKRGEVAQAVGTARARAAASGGDPNVGSFADVIRQIDAEGRVAALRERFAFQNQAGFVRQRGQNALFEGILGGSSTVLGAARRFDQVGK